MTDKQKAKIDGKHRKEPEDKNLKDDIPTINDWSESSTSLEACTCGLDTMRCIGVLPASSIVSYSLSDADDSDSSVNDDILTKIFTAIERPTRQGGGGDQS